MNLVIDTWDFSAGAQMVLSGLIGAHFAQSWGFPGLIAATIVTAVLLGTLTGLILSLIHIFRR